jgi:hypothetical protein
MGMIHLGAPFDVIPELASYCGITNFVETGTLFGGTARAAAEYFDRVYTIEKAESLYQKYHQELRAVGKIEPLLGDSKVVLPEVLRRLGDAPAVFWLDGHWSGGETAGAEDECPLVAELRALDGRQGDIILIDDARLFLSAPAAPHDPAQWPTLLEISRLLEHWTIAPFMQVIDDVIFIVPAQEKVKTCLIEYGRMRSVAFWKAYEKGRPKRTFARRVADKLAKL